MSIQAGEGDMDGMKESLSFALRLTLFITIPAMAGLMACSTPILSLLFMGGAFDYSKVVNSAEALLYYSLGLTFVALTRVLAPAFYALNDTKTPVVTAFITFILNLCLSLALMGPLKHGGLALASTLSACGNMLMLLWFLRRKIGSFGGRRIMLTGLKALMATVPMSAAVLYACTLTDWSLAGHKMLKCAVLGGAIASGVFIYIVTVRLLRSEEMAAALLMLRKKMGKV
jgi:putative peptidoglycan lipid II flippase